MVKTRLTKLRKGKNWKAIIDFLIFLGLLIFYSHTFVPAPIDNYESMGVESIQKLGKNVNEEQSDICIGKETNVTG